MRERLRGNERERARTHTHTHPATYARSQLLAAFARWHEKSWVIFFFQSSFCHRTEWFFFFTLVYFTFPLWFVVCIHRVRHVNNARDETKLVLYSQSKPVPDSQHRISIKIATAPKLSRAKSLRKKGASTSAKKKQKKKNGHTHNFKCVYIFGVRGHFFLSLFHKFVYVWVCVCA